MNKRSFRDNQRKSRYLAAGAITTGLTGALIALIIMSNNDWRIESSVVTLV